MYVYIYIYSKACTICIHWGFFKERGMYPYTVFYREHLVKNNAFEIPPPFFFTGMTLEWSHTCSRNYSRKFIFRQDQIVMKNNTEQLTNFKMALTLKKITMIKTMIVP